MAGPTWTNPKPLEPPDGKVAHGLGHLGVYNIPFLAEVGTNHAPAFISVNYNVGPFDPTRPPPTSAQVTAALQATRATGAIPVIVVSLKDFENPLGGGDFNCVDDIFADTPNAIINPAYPAPYDTLTYAQLADQFAAGVAAYGGEAIIFPGTEVNVPGLGDAAGPGYHESKYTLAYTRMKARFVGAGVTNPLVTWGWGVEASNSNWDAFKPAAAYWDWADIHIFQKAQYLTPGHSKYTNLSAFVVQMRSEGKPIIIVESGAVGADMPLPLVGIPESSNPSDPGGINAWNWWFVPFIAWVRANSDVVRIVLYVEGDHTGDITNPTDWYDARRAYTVPGAGGNEAVFTRWQGEVADETFWVDASQTGQLLWGLAPTTGEPAPFPCTVTFAQALPAGATGPALTSTVGGSTVKTPMIGTAMIPCPVGEVIETAGRPALSIEGATIFQTRTLAKWPNGTVKIASLRARVMPGTEGATVVVDKSEVTPGVSAGPNLITGAGGVWTLNTGAVVAKVKNGAFNLFDEVTIGTKTIVTSGSGPGIRAMGGDLVTSLIVRPTALGEVEENGPCYAVLRMDADLAYATAPNVTILAISVRFIVEALSPDIRVILTPRNATLARAAHVVIGSLELEAVSNLGLSPQIVVAVPTSVDASGQKTQALGAGVDDVYVYQKYSDADTNPTDGAGYKPHIAKDSGTDLFTQVGWKRVHNLVTVINDLGQAVYPEHGFLDLSGGNAGCTVAIRYMPYFWPASLGGNVNGTIRCGLYSRYNPDKFTWIWRQHESRECVFSFHDGAYGSLAPTEQAAEVAKRCDYPLFGRLAGDEYRKYDVARCFPFRMVAIDEQQSILDLLVMGHTCAVSNASLNIKRFRNAQQAGGENNFPSTETRVLDEFLRHGCGGQLYWGLFDALYRAEWAVKRSDGVFSDVQDPGPSAASELLPHTYDGVHDEENNYQHLYAENLVIAYYVTGGDERYKLALFDLCDEMAANTGLDTHQIRGNSLFIRGAARICDLVNDFDSSISNPLIAAVKARMAIFLQAVVNVDTQTTGAGWEGAAPGGARGYHADFNEIEDEKYLAWNGTHSAAGGDPNNKLKSAVFASLQAAPENIIGRTITINAGPGSPATRTVTAFNDVTNVVTLNSALAAVPTGATTFTVTQEYFAVRGFFTARLAPISLMCMEKFLGLQDAYGLLCKGRKLDLCKFVKNEMLRLTTPWIDPADGLVGQYLLIQAYQCRLQVPGLPTDTAGPGGDHPGGFEKPNQHSVLLAMSEGWRGTGDPLYLVGAVNHLSAFKEHGTLGALDSGLEIQDLYRACLDVLAAGGDPGDPDPHDPGTGGDPGNPGQGDPADPGDPGHGGHGSGGSGGTSGPGPNSTANTAAKGKPKSTYPNVPAPVIAAQTTLLDGLLSEAQKNKVRSAENGSHADGLVW